MKDEVVRLGTLALLLALDILEAAPAKEGDTQTHYRLKESSDPVLAVKEGVEVLTSRLAAMPPPPPTPQRPHKPQKPSPLGREQIKFLALIKASEAVWHNFPNDKRMIPRLAKRGLVVVENDQFRLTERVPPSE